ncbi:MAG: GatB/YqeY domain-containing protein, partial [Planctomycetota bacterium]
ERLNLPEKVKELNGEIAIVEEYLPKQLSEDEIRKIVKETVETNKFTAKEMGLAMKQIMSKCGSVVDGKKVQMILKEMLSC